MFCPNCNKENPDNSAFCTFCGTKLEQQTACDQTQSAEEAFPVIATLKKHASSTMFLVACILFAVGVGVNLLTTLVSSGTISFSTSILAAIAAFMIYSEGKKPTMKFATSGLTFMKVIAIIEAVLTAIALFLGGILLAIFGGSLAKVIMEALEVNISNGSFDLLFAEVPEFSTILEDFLKIDPSVIGIALTVLGILLIVATGFTLLFYIPAIKTINRVRTCASTSKALDTIPTLFVVMIFIAGAFNVVCLSISSMLIGASYFLFGITLNKLKADLNALDVQ